MITPASVTTRATYQDVLDAPANMVAELVNGVLHLQPRPAIRHARAASVLGARLGGSFDLDDDDPGGWWFLDEPELHLGDNVLVPDLAGWRRQIMPAIPDEPYITQAPNWVCEVLSPSTQRLDRLEKQPLYAAAGVGHLWLLDPINRGLEVFELQATRWVLIATQKDDGAVSLPPFEAVSLSLSALWL